MAEISFTEGEADALLHAPAERRYAILAHDQLGKSSAKTAHGVISYGKDPTVVVIDRSHTGKTVHEVVPFLWSDAPIVSSFK